MKKVAVLASVAAGLGLLSAPAFAQTGHAGVNYASIEGGDAETYGIDGSVAFGAGAGLTVVLDGYVTDSDDLNSTFGATAHLMSLNDSRAIGGYVGYADLDADTGISVGGEYAKFFAGSTLAVNLGYATFDDSDLDVWNLGAEYRIFATDNLRFDLGAGFSNYDAGFLDEDAVSVSAGVEYRFGGSPISLGANYTYIDADDLFGQGIDILAATLRFDFGNGSLKARDRSGSGTFGGAGGLGGASMLFGAS